MARGLGLPGAQCLDIGQFQTEAAKVQLDVEGETAVPAGQHEPVAAQPFGVGRIMAHSPLEQCVGQRREAHRRARVAVAHLLHRVGGQHPRRVDGARVHLGPMGGVVRPGERGNLFERRHEVTPGFVASLGQGSSFTP